jgi:hypothetical protein
MGQGTHTPWQWREGKGQTMIVTVKAGRITYSLEMERESKRSDHNCDSRRGRDSIHPGGGEQG